MLFSSVIIIIMNKPSYYKTKNDDIKSKMSILLGRYKKSYPLYQSNQNVNEYRSMYENDLEQIQKLLEEQFLLENELVKDADARSKTLDDVNINIEINKLEYNNIKGILQANIDSNQAGLPREYEFRYELNNEYVVLAYNIALLGVVGYFLKQLITI